ncbi:MAG: hypothetical protein ACLGI5_01300 [Thermoleophilia bacterium]
MSTFAPTAEDVLRRSPLGAAGGWIVAPLLGERAVAALARDAARAHAAGATEARLDKSPDDDHRRGNPARWLEWAAAGPALRAFYSAPLLPTWLQRLTGLDWVRTGDLPSYSYYRRPGHFLGVHRDIDTCDLAIITCIADDGAAADAIAGTLSLWPGRSGDPIAAVRADPDDGRVTVRLRPGEAIVLLGGMIPHALEPLGPRHTRITSPLCFHLT